MNIKQTLAIWTLASSLILGAPNKTKSNEITTDTKNKIEEVISIENKDILTENFEKSLEEKIFYKKKIADFKWSPLEMWWIHDRENLKQFLGLNQYKLIFEKYNKDIAKYDSKWNLLTYKNSYKNDEIKIPKIFDELRDYFPNKLEDFLSSNPEYVKKVGTENTIILTWKTEQWRHILAYYENWILSIATHISPGKKSKAITKKKKDKITWELKNVVIPWWDYSPQWVYKITKSDYYKFKKSRTFELSPMPYALHITWWVFTHHWQDVDGTKRSHGCIRVPWLYQEMLRKTVKTWTKIILVWTKS